MRQIIVTATLTAAMVLTGVGTGSAISLGGVTAPIEKYEHLVETSKGKPCTCVGATCYLIGFSVADATCDISVFQPYTAIKSWLYSCQNADAE